VAELESQVVAPEKEVFAAKKDDVDSLKRLEKAKRKKREASQLEESPIPQLQTM
jgi:hypothetical protein